MFAFFRQIKTLEIANILVQFDEILRKINDIKSLTVQVFKPSNWQISWKQMAIYVLTVKWFAFDELYTNSLTLAAM